ncbi:MAG: hypothetical protein Q9169_005756 [Polycauliona sp. 2 TL-2023]
MSSTDDVDSESSFVSPHSEQPQDDDHIHSERDSESSGGGSIGNGSKPPVLLVSSDLPSSGSEYQEQGQSATEQPRSPPHAKDVTPSARRASPVRPNKYLGPPSTWRDWTAAERQIATSLDQLRAKDLSAHLYNFYCLKRRVDSTKEWQTETDPDTVSTSRKRKAWLPVRTWTAWPMDPKAVPRLSDESTWEDTADEHMKGQKQSTFSSEWLSDALTAWACKKAKERFNEREWEDSDAELPEPPSDRESRSQLRIPELAGDTKQYEPVVMADDERAKSILQPSINHVLHQLDILLMGLHDARSSYATINKTAAHSRPVTEDESSAGQKRKKRGSRSRVCRKSSKRRSSRQSEEVSEAAAESTTSSKLKSGLGLRDWSDVLGVASASGFPPDVVARAAERCSNLFDEGIVFRTLYEGKKRYREVKYQPDVVPVETLQSFLQSENDERGSQQESEEEKFYQKESTKKALEDSTAALKMSNHNNDGDSLPSTSRRKDGDLQAKDLNQRQHPRDMPAIMLVKDTGAVDVLWSPAEANSRTPHGQGAAEIEGKMSAMAISGPSLASAQWTDQGKENVPK